MFISFEGGEGAGKTTQAWRLVERLAAQGYRPLLVHEPGSTPLGQYLRDWLKSGEPLTPKAELHLFIAARAELVSRQVLPALSQGAIVVADRYADSTVAYQGYGRGLDLDHIRGLNRSVTQGTTPDITFLLEVPIEEALERAQSSSLQIPLSLEKAESPDAGRAREGRRFEQEEPAFHQRVHDGFLAMARDEPQRWVVLDGRAPPSDLAERVWEEVATRLRAQDRQPDPRPEQPLFR